MKSALIGAVICVLLAISLSYAANDYTNSDHGDTSYGVSRTSTSGYTKGLCGHCHEMHASIDGSEPAPSAGSPSKYTLFYTNHVSQTDNFCFKCHDNTTSVAATAIMNRSYSYRAGGWTADTLNDILEAFSNPPSISSHNLGDIRTFITSKWGYTADSNPCCACHNPHAVQGDPANSGSTAKSSGTRGYPISRPSQHATLSTWGVWGDVAGEKMSTYTASYQAPYRFGSTTTYEPDGSATTNGSNLTDINTFCIDCHNATNTIYSTNLGRNLKFIDWNNEKHGKGNANVYITVNLPYTSGSGSLGYVLACTDCHEPHGSPNVFLIRKEVNGGTLGGAISSFSTTDWHYLCNRCHKDDYELRPTACNANKYAVTHHENIAGVNEDPFYPSPGSCGSCHSPAFTPKTNVLMPDRTCKPIGEIKPGDKILSFDFDNNAPRESEVVVASNHVVSETIEINGVKTTPEQLFAVGRDRWVRADQLKTGDTVLGLVGDTDDLEEIKLERPVYSKHPKGVEVTEITIKDTQKFFVIGKGKSKFLVHNPSYSCTNSGYQKVCTNCHYHGATYTYGSTWRTF